MVVFRIRNKKTGLFMTKSKSYPTWSEKGHVYNSAAACKTAIKTRVMAFHNQSRENAEIVAYELVEKGVVE